MRWVPGPIRRSRTAQAAFRGFKRVGAWLLPPAPAGRYPFEDAQAYWGNVPRAQGDRPINTLDAARWTDEQLVAEFNRELALARQKPERKEGFRLLEQLLRPLKAPRVLDYGSGIGFYGLEALARHAKAHATFCDINRHNLDAVARLACAKGHARRHECILVRDPKAQDLTFDRPFDVIVSMGVLHHTPHAPDIVRRLDAFLRPGGTFQALLYNRAYLKHLERNAGRRLGRRGFGKRTDPVVGGRSNPYSEAYDEPKARALFAGYELLRHDQPDPFYDIYQFRKPASDPVPRLSRHRI